MIFSRNNRYLGIKKFESNFTATLEHLTKTLTMKFFLFFLDTKIAQERVLCNFSFWIIAFLTFLGQKGHRL